MEAENPFDWLCGAVAGYMSDEDAITLLRTYQNKLTIFVANEKLQLQKGDSSALTVEDALELLAIYLQVGGERYSKGYREGYQDGLRAAGGTLPLSA